MNKKLLILLVSTMSMVGLWYYFVFFGTDATAVKNYNVIYYYREIAQKIKKWDNSTFVFFDVDDTIINGPDLFPQGFWNQLLFKIRVLFRYPWLARQSIWEEYYSLMWQQANRALVEADIVPTIQQMQNNGVVVLGLTSMETGSYGVIKDMPEWRFHMLAKLGILFNNRFASTIFTSLTSYRSHYPALYKGILCCNQQPKSVVLAAFFDTYQIKPGKVVFFDDKIDEVRGIAAWCKKNAIPFETYHYLGAKRFHVDYSIGQALEQLDSLVHNRIWLND